MVVFYYDTTQWLSFSMTQHNDCPLVWHKTMIVLYYDTTQWLSFSMALGCVIFIDIIQHMVSFHIIQHKTILIGCNKMAIDDGATQCLSF